MSHKVRNATIILLIFLLIGAAAFKVPIIPISYQESYEVSVPYQELVTVTKTEAIYSMENRVLANGFFNGEFALESSRLISIEWSSTKKVILLSVLKTSTYNALITALALEFGASVIGAILTGGTIGAVIAAALPKLLITTAQAIMTSDDYYKINNNYGSDSKSVPSGSYKILIININADNVMNFEVSYDYETQELQTKYRTETRYRTITDKITIWEMITGRRL